jgi:integrase
VSRCGRIGIGSRAEARPVRASRSEAQKALRKRSSGSVAAATGLRPSELFGLEQHDGDRQAGVVYVRRAFANGRIKNTKTRLRTRAVPLQAKGLHALDGLPASVNPILFPNARGGRIDFRIFGRRHWRPAQIAAGIAPIRRLYDLRHTYATFALRAGVPVFAVSRFIGSSIAMIDSHYGHLARDSREHAGALLDALALERAKGPDQQQL